MLKNLFRILMNKIVVNGRTHDVTGKDVKVVLMVDGVIVENGLPNDVHVQWAGDPANVSCGRLSVSGDINGKVSCGSLDVAGSISTQEGVSCGSLRVGGFVRADRISGGSIRSDGPIYANKVSGASITGVTPLAG